MGFPLPTVPYLAENLSGMKIFRSLSFIDRELPLFPSNSSLKHSSSSSSFSSSFTLITHKNGKLQPKQALELVSDFVELEDINEEVEDDNEEETPIKEKEKERIIVKRSEGIIDICIIFKMLLNLS